ncbi:hypothetical protein C0J52_25769 [Blattella germanica]|nr:hypothetical protein C0J52_25769 [Blattella germanica]
MDKKYTTHLDAVIAWVMETKTRINISKELPDKEKKRVIDNIMNSVYDRETEVKEVLENFTNLEKECEGAKQPVSIELQVNTFSTLSNSCCIFLIISLNANLIARITE